jgi:methylated-DNA-protein-cysteine methyltransferase-like protein
MPTPFTTRIIDIIQQIPLGRVLTYGAIATLASNPRAARQVVRILHSSSSKHDLPWWRVVNSHGKIALKGPQEYQQQKQILSSEGITFGQNDLIDLGRYLWDIKHWPPSRFAGLSDQEIQELHWKDRWEYEAERTTESLEQLSEQELVDRVKHNQLDSYFSLWYTLARKATTRTTAIALWQFLKDHPGEDSMLDRYHCATALFRILGFTSNNDELPELQRRVQWDHEGEAKRQAALIELKHIIDREKKLL